MSCTAAAAAVVAAAIMARVVVFGILLVAVTLAFPTNLRVFQDPGPELFFGTKSGSAQGRSWKVPWLLKAREKQKSIVRSIWRDVFSWIGV